MTSIEEITVKIATDFSKYPGARYRSDGPNSGEAFFIDVLKPKVDLVWNDEFKILNLDLDGTFGYASSFTSEVFTRLTKEYKDKNKIKEKIKLISNDEPLLITSILSIIDETNTQ